MAQIDLVDNYIIVYKTHKVKVNGKIFSICVLPLWSVRFPYLSFCGPTIAMTKIFFPYKACIFKVIEYTSVTNT